MSVDVFIVGCGSVGRSMGWYHAKQILSGRVAHSRLAGIVEPFLLGAGSDSGASSELRQWFGSHCPKVPLYSSVNSIDADPGEHSYALVASRTADMPQLFQELVDRGFRNIYLEKPGADTAESLEVMSELARRRGVRVAVGYNKNVAGYVAKTLEQAAVLPGSEITFVHNNAYREAELDECFERNSEGMLKNMLVHELALLCTFCSVTASNIVEVIQHSEHTSLEVRCGPSGRQFTDFRKLGFTVVTDDTKVTLRANRCGGNFSAAEVVLGGDVKYTFTMPDPQHQAAMRELKAADPGLPGYFYLQDGDYITLKERFAKHLLQGGPGLPAGVASIDVGLEALRVAEVLAQHLSSQSRQAI